MLGPYILYFHSVFAFGICSQGSFIVQMFVQLLRVILSGAIILDVLEIAFSRSSIAFRVALPFPTLLYLHGVCLQMPLFNCFQGRAFICPSSITTSTTFAFRCCSSITFRVVLHLPLLSVARHLPSQVVARLLRG